MNIKKVYFILMLTTASLLMVGCAASYIPITPNTLNYSINDFQDGISFSYKHNVLRERGNMPEKKLSRI